MNSSRRSSSSSSSNDSLVVSLSDPLLAALCVGVGTLLGVVLTKKTSLFDYRPPKVWKFKPQGGTFGGTNRPTAGPRTQEALPRGEHALQLYSLATPNGQKVTVLLEELCLAYGLEYNAWFVGLGGDQFSSGFVGANPNSKIPALLHYKQEKPPPRVSESALIKEEPPVRVFESAAIMMYVCDLFDPKHLFWPCKVQTPNLWAECLSWLFWVQGSAPFLGGGFGHFFNYAPRKYQYSIDRYTMEAKRQLDVLERHLSGAEADAFQDEAQEKKQKRYFMGGPYICGETLTIADFAIFPWYGRLVQDKSYKNAGEFLSVHEYPHVLAWANRMSEREGVRRGMIVNKTWGEGGQLRERRSSKVFESIKYGE